MLPLAAPTAASSESASPFNFLISRSVFQSPAISFSLSLRLYSEKDNEREIDKEKKVSQTMKEQLQIDRYTKRSGEKRVTKRETEKEKNSQRERHITTVLTHTGTDFRISCLR